MDHATKSFGQRLVDAGRERGRLCVGIDPHPYLLEQWGLDNSPEGLRTFSMRCVEAFADSAALVKPQVAFFERFGAAGFAVLEETLAGLREAGCLTVADAKRGDIGSTMEGYGDAWLGETSPLRADSVTLSPYLGVGALGAAIATAQENNRGVFVLAATSNPEARAIQAVPAGTADSIAQAVVDECAAFNASEQEAGVAGSVGVVVGATVDNPPRLDSLNGPVLLPGVGAQGAGPAQVHAIVSECPQLGFANVSRAVLQRGPQVDDLRKAVIDTADQFRD
ncbi:orotidine-5'-phosphate decarboxylase [Corynebacterium rhinophilum]|jgi:orotidine 5'-phosphate decarboxylase|uniref:orotidine-5'-phosphate decarboxylase n=1 Tax=Corynebacterium TaxID=1716 RepID=UPI0025501DFB|nr:MULTISPECIES: orotidine-5'-phosphate decarboxylase [unclassified Corynebacterium]MDK8452178.1 orotidine-5'-phosphate decarboxylase [Corynebacterium sp. MSK084]MDK8466509.1 orotidine-5'-phosphate decarboxylase [Corynebacterium sp. MSK130]MDK8514115.1 orotidine-5'-phosphate decarboxylase [Corynebacterium sp. MSK123]MDK8547137.1 orotidine-5'-phosphate decarboxylase [Corynebacterium sp. MSK222]MDK8687180.1 orotidine-5'-phosphate decarboxylase [Corynebacterium sp. MSK122]